MRRRFGVIIVAVIAAGVGGAVAWAIATSRATASLPVSSATIQPPGSVTAVANCPNKTKGDVLVSWTSSPSAFASGYLVTRATGAGAASAIATLAASATSYTDPTVAGATTYTYAVAATHQGW